jgi:hypothetical protein
MPAQIRTITMYYAECERCGLMDNTWTSPLVNSYRDAIRYKLAHDEKYHDLESKH